MILMWHLIIIAPQNGQGRERSLNIIWSNLAVFSLNLHFMVCVLHGAVNGEEAFVYASLFSISLHLPVCKGLDHLSCLTFPHRMSERDIQYFFPLRVTAYCCPYTYIPIYGPGNSSCKSHGLLCYYKLYPNSLYKPLQAVRRSMCRIPNTEQTRVSNRQRLGLVGVSLQENSHGRGFMVRAEPCVAKLENAFFSCRYAPSHQSWSLKRAYFIAVPHSRYCKKLIFRLLQGFAQRLSHLICIIIISIIIQHYQHYCLHYSKGRVAKSPVKSLFKSHCMQLECAPWQAVVLLPILSSLWVYEQRAVAAEDQKCSLVES